MNKNDETIEHIPFEDLSKKGLALTLPPTYFELEDMTVIIPNEAVVLNKPILTEEYEAFENQMLGYQSSFYYAIPDVLVGKNSWLVNDLPLNTFPSIKHGVATYLLVDLNFVHQTPFGPDTFLNYFIENTILRDYAYNFAGQSLDDENPQIEELVKYSRPILNVTYHR